MAMVQKPWEIHISGSMKRVGDFFFEDNGNTDILQRKLVFSEHPRILDMGVSKNRGTPKWMV